MLNDYKMEKKSVAKIGHSDRLKNFVDPNNIYVDPSI